MGKVLIDTSSADCTGFIAEKPAPSSRFEAKVTSRSGEAAESRQGVANATSRSEEAAAAAERRLQPELSDRAGFLYPKGIDRSAMLVWYARHFGAVEVNSTFYALPGIRTPSKRAEAKVARIISSNRSNCAPKAAAALKEQLAE